MAKVWTGASGGAWATDTNWRDTVTGSTGRPGAGDDVFIGGTAYSGGTGSVGAISIALPTTTSVALCKSITVSTGVTALTFSGTSTTFSGITISGGINLSAVSGAITWSATGPLRFNGAEASTNYTINMKAGTILGTTAAGGNIIIDAGATSTYTLASNLSANTDTASTTTLNSGTLNLATFSIITQTFVSSSGSSRTLNFGSSGSVTLRGVSPWSVATTGLTLTGTPNINVNYPGATSARSVTLRAVSGTNPIFDFSGSSGTGSLTFTGSGGFTLKGTLNSSGLTMNGVTCVIDTSGVTVSGAASLSMVGATLDVASNAVEIIVGSAAISLGSITFTSGANSLIFPAVGTKITLNAISPWTYTAGTVTITGNPNISLTNVSSSSKTITLGSVTGTNPNFSFFGSITGGAYNINGTGSGAGCSLRGNTGTATSLNLNNISCIITSIFSTIAPVTLNNCIFDLSGASSSLSLPSITFSGTTNTINFLNSAGDTLTLTAANAIQVSGTPTVTITGNPQIRLTNNTISSRTITIPTLASGSPQPILNFVSGANANLTINGPRCTLQGSTNGATCTLNAACTIPSSNFTLVAFTTINVNTNLTINSSSTLTASSATSININNASIIVGSGGTLSATLADITLNAGTLNIENANIMTFASITFTIGTANVINFPTAASAGSTTMTLSGISYWTWSASTGTAPTLNITGDPNINLTYNGVNGKTIRFPSTTGNAPLFNFNNTTSATGSMTFTGAAGSSFKIKGASNPSAITISTGITCIVDASGFNSNGAGLDLNGFLDVSNITTPGNSFYVGSLTGIAASIIFPATAANLYGITLTDNSSFWSWTGTCTFSGGAPKVLNNFVVVTGTEKISFSHTPGSPVPVGDGTTTRSVYPIIYFSNTTAGVEVELTSGSAAIASATISFTSKFTITTAETVYIYQNINFTSFITHNFGTLDLETYNASISATYYDGSSISSRFIKFGSSSTITLSSSGASLSTSPFFLGDTYTFTNTLTFLGVGTPTFRFTGNGPSTINFGRPTTAIKPNIILDQSTTGLYTLTGTFNLSTSTTPSFINAGVAIGTGAITNSDVSFTSTFSIPSTFTFVSGTIRLSADLECTSFVCTSSSTCNLYTTSSGYIVLSSAGTPYNVTNPSFSIVSGTLQLKTTYTGASGVSFSSSAITDGQIPILVIQQGLTPSNTITLSGYWYIKSNSSNDYANNITLDGISISTRIYLIGNVYVRTDITLGENSRLFLSKSLVGGSPVYDLYTSRVVVGGTTGTTKLISFDSGTIYLNGSGTVFDLGSTALAQTCTINSDGNILLSGSSNKTVYTPALLSQPGYPKIKANSNSYVLTLNGYFRELDFTGFSGNTILSGSDMYVYGNTIFSSTMKILGSSTATLRPQPTNFANIVFYAPIPLLIPVNASGGSGILTVSPNITSTSSFSASSPTVILQCNSISASSSIDVGNVILQPPISGDTITFTSGGGISVTGSVSNTINPIEFICTGTSGNFTSSFRQTNLSITSGSLGSYTSFGSFNNITGSLATLSGSGGVPYNVYGNTSVYAIGDVNFAPDLGTTKTLALGNPTIGLVGPCTVGLSSDINYDVDDNPISLNTQRGTLRILNDCITTSTLVSFGATSGTLDLNGRTMQIGRFSGGFGAVNFGSGGTMRLTAGGVSSGVFSWNGVFTNITSSGKIQFTANNTDYVYIQIGAGNYSGIDIELNSSNAFQNYIFYTYGNNTINNIKNMNTVKKTINFYDLYTPYSIIGFNNLQLSDMNILGNPGNNRKAYFKYTGTDYINLSNSSISWIDALQSSSPNKFIALTSNRNTDSNNNAGITFAYSSNTNFLQMF
jgi:hypothetical protein